MISNWRMLVGPRGEPVCLSFDALNVEEPILTVELSRKWYGLCLVRPSRTVEELDFGILEVLRQAPFGPSLCDHVPNPAFVERLAEEKGWEIDDFAWELIVGRWHAEIVGLRGAEARKHGSTEARKPEQDRRQQANSSGEEAEKLVGGPP